MIKVQVTHWRGKLVSKMTKEELIEALSDAHHLWRVACDDNISNIVKYAKKGLTRNDPNKI